MNCEHETRFFQSLSLCVNLVFDGDVQYGSDARCNANAFYVTCHTHFLYVMYHN